MYKNVVMVAFVVMIMPLLLDASDNQIKQDALRCVKHAVIHDNPQQEFILIHYKRDSLYEYIYTHNKVRNSYSGRKEACLRFERDVDYYYYYYYDNSSNFEVSAEQFSCKKKLAQVFRVLNSER